MILPKTTPYFLLRALVMIVTLFTVIFAGGGGFLIWEMSSELLPLRLHENERRLRDKLFLLADLTSVSDLLAKYAVLVDTPEEQYCLTRLEQATDAQSVQKALAELRAYLRQASDLNHTHITHASARMQYLLHTFYLFYAWLIVMGMCCLLVFYYLNQALRTGHERSRALELSEMRLRAILDAALDAIITIDQHGIMVQVNPAAEKMFGYGVDDMLGRNIKLLMPEPEASQHDGYLARYLAGDAPNIIGIGRKVRARRRDGSIFVAELAVNEIILHGQRMFNGVLHDISSHLVAEQALERSRDNLAKAQRIANLGSWEWNIVNNHLYWSKQIYCIFGQKEDNFDINYPAFIRFVHPHDRSAVKASEQRAMAGLGHDVEHRIILANGEMRWVHELGEVEFDAHGNPLRMTGTVQDITARKLAELAVARQTASLEALNEIASFVALDPAFQLRRALELGARHFDLETAIISQIEGRRYTVRYHLAPPSLALYDDQEFDLGETYCDLTIQHMDVFAVDDMCNSSHAGHPCYRAFKLETYIGTPLHVNGNLYGTLNFSSSAPYPRNFDTGDKEFIRMLARWCSSVLERTTMYEELLRSGERLQRSQNFANIGTWDWEIQTGHLYWSERIAPLFGHPVGAQETTYANFLNAIHPDDRAKVAAAVEACIEHGAVYNLEHRVIWPDGSVHWLLEKGDVVRDADGNPRHMLGVVQDITERHHYQEALLQAREQAERASKAKSIFLSSMSHELRTPLNSILGFAQLLQKNTQTPLTERQYKYVEHILQSGQHLLNLITEVLDLAKIEAGRLSLSLESVDCCEVLQECRNLMAALAEQRTINIYLEETKTAAKYIYADRTRLRQVVLNFLSNAIKYNHQGGRVEIGCENRPQGVVRIYVKDNGPGIPVEYHDQLFQPFNRLNAELSDIEGTGVGLALSKQLVEVMHGEIGVLSAEEQGATFWLDLPGTEASIENTLSTSLNKQIRVETKAVNKKVLYVEDNPVNLTLMEELIRYETDYTLISTSSAEEGLVMAEQECPELIILDINLPGMNGLEAVTHLKKSPATHMIPVIAMSADAMCTTIEKAKVAGFDAYLTKPINIEEVIQTLNQFLVKVNPNE